MSETQKCSMCHCVKLLTLFKIRGNTGKIYKTCIKCNERFKCDRDGCNFTCSSNADLERHIKAVHDQIKDIKCDWENCDYACSRDVNLKRHIKAVHDQIKDIKCDWENCDYACSTNEHLKQHVKAVHDQIKDFKCDWENCDYAFSTNENLKQHVKAVHNNIKDIKCNWENCNYSCSANSTLKRHVKAVHDQIRDFECPKCDYKCSTNGDLQRHIETCTGASNISSGEFKMIECFKELGFYEDEHYIHDSTFSELTTSCGKRLRFDFMFINHKRVFEFDGIQHFIPQRFGGISQEQAEENFQKIVENDKLKDDFCKNNGYKMVRISYKDYPNILSILHCELMDIMDNVG
jgi:uncharacterized Zn-finger protein